MESPKKEQASIASTSEKHAISTISQGKPPAKKSLGSLQTGMVVVCAVPQTVPYEAVAASIIQAASSGNSWGAIRFDHPIRAKAICTQRHIPERAWNALVSGASVTEAAKPVPPMRLSGITNLSVLVPEGQELLKHKVAAKPNDPSDWTELFVVDVGWPQFSPENARIGFERLVSSVRVLHATVILVVSGYPDIASLSSAAVDEVLQVEICEPDSDALLAFNVKTQMCSALWLANPEPQMLSLLKTAAGPRWRQEVFLAADVMSRQIIRMRQNDMTLDAIGKALGGVDKSTIQRRLSKLGVILPKRSE